jgi:hypothetical protein
MLWCFFFSLYDGEELTFAFFSWYASHEVGDKFNRDCEGQIWSRFKVVMSHSAYLHNVVRKILHITLSWPLWKCNIWKDESVKLNDKLESLPLCEVTIFIFKSLYSY